MTKNSISGKKFHYVVNLNIWDKKFDWCRSFIRSKRGEEVGSGRGKGGRGERGAEGKGGCRWGNKIGYCDRCRNRVIHVKCTDWKSNAGKKSGLFFCQKTPRYRLRFHWFIVLERILLIYACLILPFKYTHSIWWNRKKIISSYCLKAIWMCETCESRLDRSIFM